MCMFMPTINPQYVHILEKTELWSVPYNDKIILHVSRIVLVVYHELSIQRRH